MSSAIEKTNAGSVHHESNHSDDVQHANYENSVSRADTHGFTAAQETLPKGYFYSPFFLGTMAATGLGLSAAVGGFGLAAPALGIINADIGPDPSIVWISLVYTVTLAIGLLLVGRFSDLFGRRWFFIGAAFLALIGCIVCATAQSVNAMIAGTTLIGLAASGQQSFAFITGEIVPMKYRFAANAIMYIFVIPFAGLGPAVSQSVILHTQQGWRWCYYIMIIINFASGALFFFFYFPPTFEEKFKDRTRMQQLKDFDYIGTILFLGGFLLFLIGLSWGGSVYPWKSAHVISFIVVGAIVLVAFGLWECYGNLKEPLLPIHLFKNFAWVAACINLGLGASIYYAMAIIWPQMVAVLFANNPASMYAGYLNCCPSAMINLGQIVAGFSAEPIGKTKLQCIAVLTLGGAFLGGLAGITPDSKETAIALILIGCFFIGWNESVCLSNSGIELLDQREIGTAVGAAGSIRSAISSVASAVYVSVLTNRLTTTIPAVVPPALVQAGLPADSIPTFLAGFTTGSFANITGLTPEIQAVGVRAYKVANAQAYSTVFYTTIAFTGTAIILSFFTPNVDDKMDGKVAVTLHHTRADKQVIEERKAVV